APPIVGVTKRHRSCRQMMTCSVSLAGRNRAIPYLPIGAGHRWEACLVCTLVQHQAENTQSFGEATYPGLVVGRSPSAGLTKQMKPSPILLGTTRRRASTRQEHC